MVEKARELLHGRGLARRQVLQHLGEAHAPTQPHWLLILLTGNSSLLGEKWLLLAAENLPSLMDLFRRNLRLCDLLVLHWAHDA